MHDLRVVSGDPKADYLPVWCSSRTSPCASSGWPQTFFSPFTCLQEWHSDDRGDMSSGMSVCAAMLPTPPSLFLSQSYHKQHPKHWCSKMVGKWLWTQTRILSLKHYRILMIIYTIPAKKVNMRQGSLHHISCGKNTCGYRLSYKKGRRYRHLLPT